MSGKRVIARLKRVLGAFCAVAALCVSQAALAAKPLPLSSELTQPMLALPPGKWTVKNPLGVADPNSHWPWDATAVWTLWVMGSGNSVPVGRPVISALATFSNQQACTEAASIARKDIEGEFARNTAHAIGAFFCIYGTPVKR